MTLTAHFFAVWMILEPVLATVWRGTNEQEMCLSDHQTTMRASYDWLYEFYRLPDMVSDPHAMAV